ncbi:MAG: hypothetical protein GY719_30340 [bacterium]|nr:hypothetical protein [bacterium]
MIYEDRVPNIAADDDCVIELRRADAALLLVRRCPLTRFLGWQVLPTFDVPDL